MAKMSTIGRTARQTTRSRNALKCRELAQKDAKRQRMSSLGEKAGERIRTADVQLGKRQVRLDLANGYGVRLATVPNSVPEGWQEVLPGVISWQNTR